MLEIKNLKVEVAGKIILNHINLSVRAGEVHAIMGPNGSGKSTLAKVLAGDPHMKVRSGEVYYEGKDLLAMEPEERALAGVFMAFQYPVEIAGVNNAGFLRMAYNAKLKSLGKDEVDPLEFDEIVRAKMECVKVPESFLERSVNFGFSGGEKKRNEILQMAVLEPRLSFLDETDSGLDIDALKIVAEGVIRLKKPDNATVLVTHYQRLLNYIVPDYVHILAGGTIVKTGDKKLALEVESKGYDWLIPEQQKTNSGRRTLIG